MLALVLKAVQRQKFSVHKSFLLLLGHFPHKKCIAKAGVSKGNSSYWLIFSSRVSFLANLVLPSHSKAHHVFFVFVQHSGAEVSPTVSRRSWVRILQGQGISLWSSSLVTPVASTIYCVLGWFSSQCPWLRHWLRSGISPAPLGLGETHSTSHNCMICDISSDMLWRVLQNPCHSRMVTAAMETAHP